MSYTALITREVEVASPLARGCRQAGIELIGQSFIETKALALPAALPQAQWIFFSSAQAVKFFFTQQPTVAAHTKLAAIGRGTARHLARYGTVTFVGSAADTAVVAEEFASVVNGDTVLFPVSDQSVRTVQQALPSEQVHDVLCYATRPKPAPVGHCDVVVFSSPSNVSAYFEANTLTDHQSVIAFGSTTAARIAQFSQKPVAVLGALDDESILAAIKSALGC